MKIHNSREKQYSVDSFLSLSPLLDLIPNTSHSGKAEKKKMFCFFSGGKRDPPIFI